MYKYSVTLKQFKRRAGLGGGTRQLHHKHILEDQVVRQVEGCVYDGAELGSTGGLVEEWSCPDVSSVNANKLNNCKRKLFISSLGCYEVVRPCYQT